MSVGGNREAARIAGVPVRRTVFSVYCISGLLAGVAAVLLCGRLGSASPVSGELLELDAIGATVIGGTSLAGGRATIVGTFMGVVVFGLIFNLLTQLEPGDRMAADRQGGDHPRRRSDPATRADLTRSTERSRRAPLPRPPHVHRSGRSGRRDSNDPERKTNMKKLRHLAALVAVPVLIADRVQQRQERRERHRPTAAAVTTARDAAARRSSAVPPRPGHECRHRQEGHHRRQRAAHRPRLAGADRGEGPGGRRQFDDVDFRLLEAADADSQASQIETVINEHPDALVVLPYDGAQLTPVAEKAMEAGIPVDQRRPPVRQPRCRAGDDPRRQLPDRRQGGDVHRRQAELQGQRRRDPGHRRHLGDHRPQQGLRRHDQDALR